MYNCYNNIVFSNKVTLDDYILLAKSQVYANISPLSTNINNTRPLPQ